MKLHNKLTLFLLLFVFNVFSYAQPLDILGESWPAVQQKLIEAGETNTLLELEIWFDIEKHYQLAQKAYNKKIRTCRDIANNNKPPIADLLQSQFGQQYIQDNRENIGRVLVHLNFKLDNVCSQKERDEYIRAEMLYFSNMEHYLHNVKALINDGYFEQELVDNVSKTIKEVSSQLDLDKNITLDNIEKYYFEMPFSITDTHMILSYETQYELYERKALQAPLEIYELLVDSIDQPFSNEHFDGELVKLFPEIYQTE